MSTSRSRAIGGLLITLLAVGIVTNGPFVLTAAAQMDLRQAAGVPRPDAAVPAGTVIVRVVRGSFANNLAGVDVVFTADGRATTVKTKEDGRAQVEGLKQGARLRVSAVVDGERLESQETTVGDAGIRLLLLASESSGAAAASGPPQPAVPGRVTFGPQSRIVADYSDERLKHVLRLEIVNSTATLVDIGGPLVVDLPAEARGAEIMDGSTPQAKVIGGRLTVLGPFAPGATKVNLAYALRYDGPTAHLEQRWPVEAATFGIFALKSGDLDLVSAQLTSKQSSVQQGQPLIIGILPALPHGQPLVVDVTGLPHHAAWPRNVALGSASTIAMLGLWAAFGPASRRRRP